MGQYTIEDVLDPDIRKDGLDINTRFERLAGQDHTGLQEKADQLFSYGKTHDYCYQIYPFNEWARQEIILTRQGLVDLIPFSSQPSSKQIGAFDKELTKSLEVLNN